MIMHLPPERGVAFCTAETTKFTGFQGSSETRTPP